MKIICDHTALLLIFGTVSQHFASKCWHIRLSTQLKQFIPKSTANIVFHQPSFPGAAVPQPPLAHTLPAH